MVRIYGEGGVHLEYNIHGYTDTHIQLIVTSKSITMSIYIDFYVVL